MENTNQSEFENNSLTNNEMSGIYFSLSTSQNMNVDVEDDLRFVQTCIEEVFDEKFRYINNIELQSNTLLLNKKFIELLKYCNQKANFKKVGYIFIGFCDYFDLDVTKVYSQLHEKIQMMINYSAKCLCGVKTYEKVKHKNDKHPDLNIPNLFNLIK